MDLLIVIRVVHYGAAMLLFGGGVFEQMLAPEALRVQLTSRHTTLWLALLVLVSAILWFMGETADIGTGWGDAINPQTLLSIATGTPFGSVWVWHMALAPIPVALCFVRGDLGRWLQLDVAAIVLGSLALVGHAAMDDGILGLMHRGNDMIHLLAAGFWLGALPPLAMSLRLAREPAVRQPVVVALRRFSGLGILAVAAILVTGIANALLILLHGQLGPSPYWLLLGAKVVLVLGMVGFALVNRFRLMPRLKTGNDAFGALRRNTLVEFALGAGVVALVSVFGTLDPG